MKLINTPVKLSRTPGGVRGMAPKLGQDTAEVLSEILGLTGEEIDKLKEENIVQG